jgi:hypothetical protein
MSSQSTTKFEFNFQKFQKKLLNKNLKSLFINPLTLKLKEVNINNNTGKYSNNKNLTRNNNKNLNLNRISTNSLDHVISTSKSVNHIKTNHHHKIKNIKKINIK